MFKRDMRLFPYTLNSAFFALCFLRYIVIGKGEFIMWVLYAVGSAFFSGITAILAKCGIRKTDSTVATAVRTVVVLVFSWLMVFFAGSAPQIKALSVKTWVFLILSGMATGASWLCYFKALQTGDINKVVPIDKSSTILTMLLAFIFLGERFTWVNAIAVLLITAGTFMMIQKTKKANPNVKANKMWLIYALLSAVFASLTSILGKIGIENVESNLGTAIRTCVVLIMAWLMVFVTGKKARCGRSRKRNCCSSAFPDLLPAGRGSVIIKRFRTGLPVWLCRSIN